MRETAPCALSARNIDKNFWVSCKGVAHKAGIDWRRPTDRRKRFAKCIYLPNWAANGWHWRWPLTAIESPTSRQLPHPLIRKPILRGTGFRLVDCSSGLLIFFSPKPMTCWDKRTSFSIDKLLCNRWIHIGNHRNWIASSFGQTICCRIESVIRISPLAEWSFRHFKWLTDGRVVLLSASWDYCR